ncbi:molybdate ABC transporter substrate-binding protein [Kineococcus sp. GCM10028916]|uniref:molybdate ABC transporter substrate-binding protein n=1 Tax=Kineococcus sp. GCM10028916 TaxID=3273394 RepID=UPI003643B6F7
MRPVIALVAVGGLLAACGSGDDDTATPAATSSSTSAAARTLTVFAAASLKGSFTEIGREFEAANPGVTVRFSFAGSSDLVTQITEGAPADVFASADEKNMTKVTDQSLTAAAPVDFATNVLEIATPAGNPAGIKTFADLAKPGVKVVVCAAQVPCGSATQTVETSSGVTLSPVSEESSVTDVLGKVTSGEADAGLVYVTDVTSAGEKVTGVEFPESAGAVNTYPIAALQDAQDADLASEFVTFVTGTAGEEVLRDAGFGAPAK